MPDRFSRYAVFYTPPAGSDFATAGARWLGWDAAAGQEMPHPELGLDLAPVTQTPRKYGLHGTLRAPMRLGTAQGPFFDAVETFARSRPPVALGRLRLRALGPFLAVPPTRKGRRWRRLPPILSARRTHFARRCRRPIWNAAAPQG